jgi:hypothetical protein
MPEHACRRALGLEDREMDSANRRPTARLRIFIGNYVELSRLYAPRYNDSLAAGLCFIVSLAWLKNKRGK